MKENRCYEKVAEMAKEFYRVAYGYELTQNCPAELPRTTSYRWQRLAGYIMLYYQKKASNRNKKGQFK